MDTFLQNLRVAVRALRRSPGVAALAILALALGIGLSTAVFTVADALLLRRFPVREQNRLVVLWEKAREHAFDYPVTYADGEELVRGARTLERGALFLFNGAGLVPVREGDQVTRLSRALVSGEFFDVLGANAALGRPLNRADDVRGAPPVVVLSYSAWQRHYNGDPHILGHRIVMYEDGTAYTIVGVMPQGLDYPRGTDFWAPVAQSMTPEDLSLMGFFIIGRLAPGTTADNAAAELTAFLERAGAAASQRALRGIAHPWPSLVLGDVGPALIAFGVAAGLLLLITCLNVANLLLMRGITRVREIAVRSALGASRSRIVGQLLTESALLAAVGGALGVAVAAIGIQTFAAFAPAELARLAEIRLNATALAGALVITTLATVLFAVLPALVTSHVQLQRALYAGTRQSASRRARFGTEMLVAGQLMLAVLVLAAAGVVTRSLDKLQHADLSFEPSHVLIGELAFQSDLYADAAKQRAVFERLVPTLEATLGVLGASPVVAVPFSGAGGWDGKPAAAGQSAEQEARNPMLNMEVVTPDYFVTLGIPVLAGRGFTDMDRENLPAVVVVSQSAASSYWPGESAIGKHLKMGPQLDQLATVVGVVPDTRYRDLRDGRPSIYFPLRQSSFPFAPTTLAIKTTGDPTALVPTIRRVISETEPGVALVSATPFKTLLEGPVAQPRLNALLIGCFAVAAVLLAGVGLFGVMATMVRQRTHELGIRLALGAAPRDLARMVIGRGLAIGATGLVLGLFGALFANRLMVAMLYEVSATDARTLLLVAGVLLSVAAVACAIPARLSTRVDPLLVLRSD